MTFSNRQRLKESIKENAIIFDLDGTLIDSQNSIINSIQIVLTKMLNREVSIKEVTEKFHPDWRVLILNFGIELNDNSEKKLIELWIREAKNQAPEIKPFFFADELLSITHREFDLYLWTGRDRSSTEQLLAKWGLNHYFVNISCGDDSIGSKPSIESFQKLVMDNYKFKMMIGDSLLDLYGAEALKMPFLAVTWCNGSSKDTLKNAGAINFANNPQKCLKMIRDLSKT